MNEDHEPIPDDLRQAFDDAVSCYKQWTPGSEGRRVSYQRRSVSIDEVCYLTEHHDDPLPDAYVGALRGFLKDARYDDLRHNLDTSQTYGTGAFCLRLLVQRRKAEYGRAQRGL